MTPIRWSCTVINLQLSSGLLFDIFSALVPKFKKALSRDINIFKLSQPFREKFYSVLEGLVFKATVDWVCMKIYRHILNLNEEVRLQKRNLTIDSPYLHDKTKAVGYTTPR